MKEHSNAAILKAYADNTDLFIFILDSNSKWIRTNPKALMDYPDDEFFACLPQHNENGQCLHWLNGGEIQDYYENEWSSVGEFNGGEWSIHTLMMDENANYRIKPRTEKRWIAIRRSDLFVEDCLFHSVENAIRQGYPESQWQLHEIEVEV